MIKQRRGIAWIFSFVLIFSIFNVGFVVAPSHPVLDENFDGVDDITGESLTGGEKIITFEDYGETTPSDGFGYNWEIFWEDFTGVSEYEQLQERYSEVYYEMMINHDYDAAGEAWHQSLEEYEKLQSSRFL